MEVLHAIDYHWNPVSEFGVLGRELHGMRSFFVGQCGLVTASFDCVMEHSGTSCFEDFLNGVVDAFDVVRFEVLIGWMVLEQRFKINK